MVAVPVAVAYREWSADRQAAFREWKDERARRDPEAEESSKLEEPRSDRRRDAEASPARESTAQLGRGERDEAPGGRTGNRVAVPPDASELDEGVLVVHDREGEEGEAMAVPAYVESSQQLLGDLLDAMVLDRAGGK